MEEQTSHKRYFLAVDGGGSKTDAVLVAETGDVLGWGRGGPVHSFYSSPEEVRASFEQAIKTAIDERTFLELYVAGAPPTRYVKELVERFAQRVDFVPCGEIDTAFASAQRDWGLIVLSGTGSFVFGLTPEGQARHYGGLGPILGDYGSAYQIGLLGLRAAFASRWTAARRTALEAEVPKHFGLSDLRAVFERIYGPGLSRREIASVARLVDELATAGDRIAIRCLQKAAEELAAVALDVIRELRLAQKAFPMIAVGSVAQKSRIWWARLCEKVRRHAPQAEPIIPELRPVLGAALLAMKQAQIPWTPELIARIKETQTPFLQRLSALEKLSQKEKG